MAEHQKYTLFAKYATTTRSNYCWHADAGSKIDRQLEGTALKPHVVMMVKGCDGLWTTREPWKEHYAHSETEISYSYVSKARTERRSYYALMRYPKALFLDDSFNVVELDVHM